MEESYADSDDVGVLILQFSHASRICNAVFPLPSRSALKKSAFADLGIPVCFFR